jgi:phosphate transport system protein
MVKHLQRDLDGLKRRLLEVGSMVEEATGKAIRALVDRHVEMAREVKEGDTEIDRREVDLEEECLKILALHQPVAADLRFIITALKVNNDLERMGDLAANIADRAMFLAGRDPVGVPLDFPRMAENVRVMVGESLDSLVRLDTVLARDVLTKDDLVDRAHKEMFRVLQKKMHDDPEAVERAVHLLSASRHLERIADLATNIAEDVVFLVEGEVIRHGFETLGEGGANSPSSGS